MFKFLRKITLGALLVLVAGGAFLYLRNPLHRRGVAQGAEELVEVFKGRKKPTWSGTVVVVDVLEGDKLLVNTEANSGVTVCLAGVDAPEMPDKFKRNGQPLAEESRQLLAHLVKDKAVEMSIVGTDLAKRPLVLLTLDGKLVNAEIARAGLAEAGGEGSDAMSARLRHSIENAELAARQERTNVWGLANYVRPVEHRIRFPDPADVAVRR